MPGLVPGIHALLYFRQDVDGRVKPGHDDGKGAHGLTSRHDDSPGIAAP
jgi:hypothetical protein